MSSLYNQAEYHNLFFSDRRFEIAKKSGTSLLAFPYSFFNRNSHSMQLLFSGLPHHRHKLIAGPVVPLPAALHTSPRLVPYLLFTNAVLIMGQVSDVCNSCHSNVGCFEVYMLNNLLFSRTRGGKLHARKTSELSTTHFPVSRNPRAEARTAFGLVKNTTRHRVDSVDKRSSLGLHRYSLCANLLAVAFPAEDHWSTIVFIWSSRRSVIIAKH